MKTPPPKTNAKNLFLVILSITLLSAIPYFAGSGLDNPEPIGTFLNGNFPDRSAATNPYISAFPNLTFDSPLTFTPVPNSNKLVVGQRDGKIYWFENRNDVPSKNLLADFSNEVGVVWDGGFLGLSIHPEFGTAGKNFFYLFYTTKDAQGRDYPNSFLSGFGCNREDYWGSFLILKRIEVNPTNLNFVEGSDLEMIKMRMFSSTHRGGGMSFGNDGYLYIPTGDQSAYSKSQITTTNLDGGVLRIDVDQNPLTSHNPIRTMPEGGRFADEISGVGYSIPNDNPFPSSNGDRFEEYYTIGHRNPHRMTKDKLTGTFYIGEIGESKHEEINVIKPGKNYGWPVYEGNATTNRNCINMLDGMSHEGPLVSFPRSEANAIIGGYVYRGNAMPDYYGKYICADYGVGEEIWAVDTTTGEYDLITQFSPTNIISFGEDNSGELYLLSQGDNVPLYKLRQNGELEGSIPSLLSETGAFQNLQTLEPSQGVIPYELIESFWSDGAEKKRWMAIPNNGSHNTSEEQISFSEDGDWEFPVGSVLIKHFELPLDENNPSNTKRLETRFSVKTSSGSFYFLTYKWNDQQTDAILLESGLDENIQITKADGSIETQTWSYPSTQDCVSCHNPATGGTLGARTRYLNSDYTYEKTGRTSNQLVTLSHLGILDANIDDAASENFQTYKAINDETATLDEKARSYFDLNCAYCHRPGGTGDRAQFDLRLFNDLQQTGLMDAGTNTPIGIPGEKILVSGNASRSIIYHRTNSTDPSIMMPPISKNRVDEKAVKLIEDWINQMEPDPCANRIIMETFNNVTGITIAELRNNGLFPDDPSKISQLNEFSIPVNAADDYGAKVKGILKAPETGIYYFWVSGDDNVELNLSSNENPDNISRIAFHDNWTNFSQWNKYPTQKSTGISLEAGELYYIEALMNERGGGDNLSVGWRKPSDGNGTNPVEVLQCNVFVDFTAPNMVAVTGVSLTPESTIITETETLNLSVNVIPNNATEKGVSWTSNDETIAVVDAEGKVTAVKEGAVSITVTTIDGGFTATSTITVEAANIAVTSVSITPETLSLIEGETEQLSTLVSPENASNKTLNWSSNDTNIATTDTNGLITAISQGTATITATSVDGGYTATATVTVTTEPVSNVQMLMAPNPADYVVYVYFGSSEPLVINTLNIYDSTNALVKVFNDPASVLVEGDNYKLSINDLPVGTYTVEGVSNSGNYSSQLSIERDIVPVTGMNLNVTNTSVQVGESVLLTTTFQPANASDKSVFWSSSDSSIANVDVNGNVLGLTQGEVIITATSVDGGYTATATVTVTTEPVSSVQMLMAPNPADYVVYVYFGSSEPLVINTLNIYDSTNALVKVFNDPASVLVEGDNYKLSINDLPVGTYTVEGVSNSGNYSSQLSIERDIVPVAGMNLNVTDTSVQVGESILLTTTFQPANASDKSVLWSSSDSSIANVDGNGNVLGLTQGEVIITATSVDGGYTATATVTVTTEPVSSVQMLMAPNPADYVVYVYFGSSEPLVINTLNIYDSTNALVKVFNDPASVLVEGDNYKLNINDLPVGTYTVEGVSDTGNYSSQLSIERDIVPVIDLGIDIIENSITIGEEFFIPRTITPDNATLSDLIWTSSNLDVAAVDENGIVTGLSAGESVISLSTADGGLTDTATIIITDVIMLVAPNPTSFNIYIYFYSPEPIEIITINIYDQTGRLVLTFEDPASFLVDGENYRFVIADLPSGNYFVEGVTSKGNYQKMVIKE